jgi:hypothetical protein
VEGIKRGDKCPINVVDYEHKATVYYVMNHELKSFHVICFLPGISFLDFFA